MKNLFITLCSVLCLCACQQKTDGFVVTGTLKNATDGGRVVLINQMTGAQLTDSAQISGGQFVIKGKVEQPELCLLLIDMNVAGEQPDYNKLSGSELYLENTPITYEADLATLPTFGGAPGREGKATITGSESQKTYEAFLATIKPDMDYEAMEAAVLTFIKENPASIVALDRLHLILTELPAPYTAEQIDELVALLEPNWKGTARWTEVENAAAKAKKTAIGQPYIDGEFLTPDGELVKLSSLITPGQYTLLEFWASWCAPCRAEIPHFKEVHKKYKDFRIISVSIDQQEDAWKTAMKQEGMDWIQLRNPEGFGGIVQSEYGIVGIPACILLDKEGRFFKTNMRGEALDAFLQETYK